MPELDDVRLFEDAIPNAEFAEMGRTFPPSHFLQLKSEGFRFYQTTFWLPLDSEPGNIFERVTHSLLPLADPSSDVVGVEWWFSVGMTNATPQWILPCHFDRNDLAERNFSALKFPYRSSVLFLTEVPYGELVVTDQILTEKGISPAQPAAMRFIAPRRNLYATFPGHLYHGVIGRMWRPILPNKLRLTMAVNWWTDKPKSAYIRDSRDCMAAFRLDDAIVGARNPEMSTNQSM
jgi:hypothetical protein